MTNTVGTVSPTLLLVEDDPGIRQALTMALADEGHTVLEAPTGEHALELLKVAAREISVVLLDVMLPGIDGLDVCRRIRSSGDVPIILVTARSDSADVVAGLEAGADDYVTKPVVASELSARIRALLRRVRTDATARVVRIGDLAIDTAGEQVHRDGREIRLTKTEFRLLCETTGARGALVTREHLLDAVWGYGYYEDSRVLDVHMNRLRTKIEADPHRPDVIITVRGRGYRSAT